MELRFEGIWWPIFLFFVLLVVFRILVTYIAHMRKKKEVKEIVSKGGIDYLVHKLKEDEHKEEVLEALAESKEPRAVDAIIDFINSPRIKEDEDKYFFTLGLNAIGKIGNQKAIDFLIQLLDSKNEIFIRDYVGCVLGNMAVSKGIKVFQAVKPLIDLLEEAKRIKYNLEWTQYALESITGEKFGSDFEKWQRYRDENQGKYQSS